MPALPEASSGHSHYDDLQYGLVHTQSAGDSKTPLYANDRRLPLPILLWIFCLSLSLRWGFAVQRWLRCWAQVLASVYCILAIRKIELLKTQPVIIGWIGRFVGVSLPCRSHGLPERDHRRWRNGGSDAWVNGFGVASSRALPQPTSFTGFGGGCYLLWLRNGTYAVKTWARQQARISQGLRAGLHRMVTSLLITAVMFLFEEHTGLVYFS